MDAETVRNHIYLAFKEVEKEKGKTLQQLNELEQKQIQPGYEFSEADSKEYSDLNDYLCKINSVIASLDSAEDKLQDL